MERAHQPRVTGNWIPARRKHLLALDRSASRIRSLDRFAL